MMAGYEAYHEEIVTERKEKERGIKHPHHEWPEVTKAKQDLKQMLEEGGQALIGSTNP